MLDYEAACVEMPRERAAAPMTAPFTESVVEEAALEWFAELGYAVVFGPSIAPDEPAVAEGRRGKLLRLMLGD